MSPADTAILTALQQSVRLQGMKRACKQTLFDVPEDSSCRLPCRCVVKMNHVKSESGLCVITILTPCREATSTLCALGVEPDKRIQGRRFVIQHQQPCQYDAFHAILVESFAA